MLKFKKILTHYSDSQLGFVPIANRLEVRSVREGIVRHTVQVTTIVRFLVKSFP